MSHAIGDNAEPGARAGRGTPRGDPSQEGTAPGPICDGLLVLEMGTGRASAVAGMILADNGALVVKLEPPGGDRLRQDYLSAFLAWNRGKDSVILDGLLARLRAAPAGTSREKLAGALRDAVLAAVAVLQALNASAKNLDKSVAAHPGEHPDGEIFTSLPRPGQINAAQVLAERDDCRPAYEHPDSAAALAGVTPVTRESGKHRSVHFRWACNKRFRAAVTTFADNSRHASPRAARTYNDARAAGKDHPHAVRILARARVRVIYRCWLDGVPYDPARHAAAALAASQQAA